VKYRDHPLHECVALAEKYFNQGGTVYQKWTCGKCGERVMANEPNTFTELGHHEEKADGSPCGYITDIRKTGCNWALHMPIGMKPQ
jgi:hypothetical protein